MVSKHKEYREEDVIHFHGHSLIKATHATTFEVTTENYLTERGTCIIGIGADKGCMDLKKTLKKLLCDDRTTVEIKTIVNGTSFVARAQGSANLDLDHPSDIVIRTSSFTSSRTIAIQSDKAASDIPQAMRNSLTNPEAQGLMIISAWI